MRPTLDLILKPTHNLILSPSKDEATFSAFQHPARACFANLALVIVDGARRTPFGKLFLAAPVL